MTGEGRHLDRVSTHEAPLSLPPSAVGQPIHALDPPMPVHVRISRHRHGWVRLDGEANAFTKTAGHVHFRDEQGRTGVAWVWAGAITRRR